MTLNILQMTLKKSVLALVFLALILLVFRAILGNGAYSFVLYVGIGIGLISTVVALFAGLGVMTFGAATQNKVNQAKWTTYLMRSRVFAQGMTVICGTLLLISRGENIGGL